MKKANAKFYCENCGAEVPSNARVCKNCGRFFSAVRCPQCGATGTVSKFEKGCPVCGYAMSTDELNGITSSLPADENQKRRTSRAEKKNLKTAFASHNTAKKMQGDGTLPLWIYAVTIVVLGSVIAALVLLLKRP